MRKKLNNESGLTVVEMLAATAIMLLLALLLGTGTQMAMNTYETIVAQNELELLLSTAVDALADELRYARNVVERPATEIGPGEANFKYTSDPYGTGTLLKWNTGDNNDGQLMALSDINADGFRVLSSGAYGLGDAYRKYKLVEDSTYINYDEGSGVFSVRLTVATTETETETTNPDEERKGISASTEVTISCLNYKPAPAVPDPDPTGP